jgi:hypothetical protein
MLGKHMAADSSELKERRQIYELISGLMSGNDYEITPLTEKYIKPLLDGRYDYDQMIEKLESTIREMENVQ